MAMQIHGNPKGYLDSIRQGQGSYDYSGSDYAERVKEKQAAERAEKAKEAEKAAEEKNAGKLSEPRDEYISSEKAGQKPTGLYWVGQDENGNRKIFFDDPEADHTNGKDDRSEESEDGKAPKVYPSGHPAMQAPDGAGGLPSDKVGGDSQGKPAEKCVTNTDKVDREIKKLKEKKQQLKQQIQSVSGDETSFGHPSMPGSAPAEARVSGNNKENKIRELQKKLAQVEKELSQKDNDTYRRQNASVSE